MARVRLHLLESPRKGARFFLVEEVWQFFFAVFVSSGEAEEFVLDGFYVHVAFSAEGPGAFDWAGQGDFGMASVAGEFAVDLVVDDPEGVRWGDEHGAFAVIWVFDAVDAWGDFADESVECSWFHSVHPKSLMVARVFAPQAAAPQLAQNCVPFG